MARQSKFTLLIICEGKNTEPNLFASIRDRIMEGRYAVEEMVITIRPEPVDELNAEEKKSELKPKRPSRTLLPPRQEIEGDISGVPPLKWVEAGQLELRQGTFNEVWVVFDNDNHPAKAQAFTKAEEIIDDKRVNIAYSSIAFEYYLLLHFEKIYKAFEKSECREGRKVLNCSSGEHSDDCWGETCVGGYARINGYWDDSKTTSSLFPLIEDKLEIGFRNAVWLRYMSDLQFPGIPVYNRNPYVTTDRIVRRLTGYGDDIVVVAFEQIFDIEDKIRVVYYKNLTIKITNISDTAIVVPAGSITKTAIQGGVSTDIGERIVLLPEKDGSIIFASSDAELIEFEYQFRYGDSNVMLQTTA